MNKYKFEGKITFTVILQPIGDGKEINMNHYCKIEDIKIRTKLSAKQAYDIAKRYHREHHIDGEISDDMNQAIYLDECNHITDGITWMVRSKFKENTFEGMDKLTIMVSDNDGQVCNVLDHNGIPINNEHEQLYSDEEFYQLFDEDEIL